MGAVSNIILILAVAFNLMVAAVMPAKACVKPCCRHATQKEVSAGCESCGSVKLSAPIHRCCGEVAADGGSSPATLNTGAPLHQGQLLTADAPGPSGRPSIPDAPSKPGFAFGTYKSPPVYMLTSSYLC